jgi:hypothetical protein
MSYPIIEVKSKATQARDSQAALSQPTFLDFPSNYLRLREAFLPLFECEVGVELLKKTAGAEGIGLKWIKDCDEG